jgi:RecJ-like exonuclease
VSGAYDFYKTTEPTRLRCDLSYSDGLGDVTCPKCKREGKALVSVRTCTCCGRHEELYQCPECKEWIETDVAAEERAARRAEKAS